MVFSGRLPGLRATYPAWQLSLVVVDYRGDAVCRTIKKYGLNPTVKTWHHTESISAMNRIEHFVKYCWVNESKITTYLHIWLSRILKRQCVFVVVRFTGDLESVEERGGFLRRGENREWWLKLDMWWLLAPLVVPPHTLSRTPSWGSPSVHLGHKYSMRRTQIQHEEKTNTIWGQHKFSMKKIQIHIHCLTAWGCCHRVGAPLLCTMRLYGPLSVFTGRSFPLCPSLLFSECVRVRVTRRKNILLWSIHGCSDISSLRIFLVDTLPWRIYGMFEF